MKLHGMKFFYGKVDIGLMKKIYCKKIPTGDMALKQQRKNLEKVTRVTLRRPQTPSDIGTILPQVLSS